MVNPLKANSTGQNIICFAKNWNENPTSCNHILTQLAKNNRVLWLNSLSMRAPDLSKGDDLKKIVTKIKQLFQKVENVQDDLWISTPFNIPLPHHPIAVKLNRQIVKLSLKMLRRKLGMKEFQLWTFLPNVVDYMSDQSPSVSVFYCVDDWAAFPYLDAEKIAAQEKALCEHVDVVFATAGLLVERKKVFNPETHLASHGVNHAVFSQAMREETTIPDDIASINGPILGFFGTIEDRVDLPLLEFLAERHPEWSLVFIGQELVDTSSLRRLPNVHFLGRRAHEELPRYCKGFSVGLIPFLTEERMQSINPIKLREYLSAGLPVVSTALREVMYYSDVCYVGETPEAIEAAIQRALDEDSPKKRRARSEAMEVETWEQKTAQVFEHVMRVKALYERK